MTEEEKKPIVGQEFLSRAAAMMMKKASGKGNNSPNEDKKTDWKKEAETAEERRRYELSMKAMSGDERVAALQMERDRERDAEREAAATRAQQLEDERNQRTQADIGEAKRIALEEGSARKRLEEEQRASERATLEQKQAEMTEKFNQAMQANSPASFLQNYRTWKELQHELNPEEKPGTSTDPMIAIELKKLELQQAKEDREFKWKMRQDEKQFQLEMKKMEDDREFRRIELAQQAKKDEMFTSFPQRLGGAIAKGMIDSEAGGGPAPQNISRKGAGNNSYHIEVGAGESGEVDCPKCHTAVGVSPTGASAVCVGCGSRFEVSRKPAAMENPPVPVGSRDDSNEGEEE